MVYSGGRIATLTANINADLPSEAVVVGTKGTLKVRQQDIIIVIVTPAGEKNKYIHQQEKKRKYK